MKLTITEGQLKRLILKENFEESHYDEFEEVLSTYHTTGVLEFDLDNLYDEKQFNTFQSMLSIIDELKQFKVESYDYLNINNLGFNNEDQLCYFDIGWGSEYDFKKEPEQLELAEVDLGFDETLLRKIGNKFGASKIELLGDGGANGSAYDIGDNKVMKITLDRSEAVNCKKIEGKDTHHLAKVYSVNSLKLEKEYFVIILEKLRLDPDLINVFFEINEVIEDYIDSHIDMGIIDIIGKKNPLESQILKDFTQLGKDKTLEKNKDILSKITTNVDSLFELTTWMKGSVTNSHSKDDEAPEELMDFLNELL